MLATNSCWSSSNFFCFRVIVGLDRDTNLETMTRMSETSAKDRRA